MKKLLLLALVSLLALTACNSKKTGDSTEKGDSSKAGSSAELVDLSTVKGSATEFTSIFSSNFNRLDYLAVNDAPSTEHLSNFVDSLLENDTHGKYVPALAERYEKNDDSSVWTFYLRKGVNWVTAEGEVYGEVKADDFVAGLQHAFDSQSKVLNVIEGVIKGVTDFKEGKLTDFSQVGVKALDDYTVQYTLEKPVPYFHTMVTYNILLPASRSFLESKGCTPGEDQTNCTFGSSTPDSILYNGPYILTSNVEKSEIKYTKNENYWDKDKISIEKVTYIYDDGSDSYSVLKGFQSGTYASAGFNTKWADYAKYIEKYANYKTIGLPNSSVFGIQINYNRKNYNYTDKTPEERENTKVALQNKNFRLALRSAYDVKAYLMATLSEAVAESNIRNINSVPDLVQTSDGTRYVDLVQKAYAELTGETLNLDDGKSAWFNPEKVKGYLEAAEKEGVKLPVKLDVLMPNDLGEGFINRAASLKNSVEKNSDGKILVTVNYIPYDVMQSVAFLMEDPTTSADYDINTFAGWGPDFNDPYTFAGVLNTKNGDFLKNMGLLPNQIDSAEATTGETSSDTNTSETTTAEAGATDGIEALLAENDKIAEVNKAIKLDVYTKMVNDANDIVDNLDERYKAFAKAEAFMLSEAIYIPTSMQTRNERVSRVVPFTKSYAVSGLGSSRLKGLKLSETVITKEQYEKAKEEWLKN